MNTIGYILGGHHNDTEMFERKDATVPKCAGCGYRLDFFPHNPSYVFKKTFKPGYMPEVIVSKSSTALSMTYDGQVIVSKAFKDFCLQQGYEGLVFLEFLHDKEHFHFGVTPQIKVDVERSKLQFGKLCPVCKKYDWIGPTPRYFQITEPLADGFYRSDLIFGDQYSRHPFIVVAIETYSKLLSAQLRGLEFQAVYGLG